MINIGMDPHHLCDVATTQQWMLLRMIEQTIDDKLDKMPFGEERNHLAAFFGFRREEWAPEMKDRKRLPWGGFLVHCASNYLSVFSKVADPSEFTPLGFSYEGWKFESSHDSCWTECFKRWYWEHQGEIIGFAWSPAVEWKTLTDEQVEKFREIKREAMTNR
jgi:hypothetical protein